MFRKLEDFTTVYGRMRESTSKILSLLNEKNIERAVAPGHRSLGQMAWHIVTSVPEMMNRTGLGLESVDARSMPPEEPAEILRAYRTVTDELLSKLKESWNDETLLQTDEMYGERWPRGMTLAALVTHEAHHRGQMTVLLRQAGEMVPGVYGPSKEEWEKLGLQAPPY